MALKIFITAGEASGDILGVRLMRALREAAPGCEFRGVGGAAMTAEGLQTLFPIQDLSVMGIAEVIPRLPKILRRIRQTVAAAKAFQPDIFITIDSPDFSFRVARALKQAGGASPKMFHYVAPTVWAWRAERAKKIAALYDGILCLLPFEPPYFERAGMKAAFVGHAMMESGLDSASGAAFRERHGIPADAFVLGTLFGSRMGELNRMGPVLRAAALQMAKEDRALHIVAPTLPHLQREVMNYMQKMPCATHITVDREEKAQAFRAMDLALATSGTVGLELAVADVPHIIGYKMSGMTYDMVKKRIKIKYAHLANILLDAPVVPEFIQDSCQPDLMARTLHILRSDRMERLRQKQSFEKVRSLIAAPNDEKTPSQMAAAFILDVADVGGVISDPSSPHTGA